MKAPYKVLLEGKSAETELKKSRFITLLKPVETEEEAQEFKDFIQNIKPSDFEKLMKGKHEESDQ